MGTDRVRTRQTPSRAPADLRTGPRRQRSPARDETAESMGLRRHRADAAASRWAGIDAARDRHAAIGDGRAPPVCSRSWLEWQAVLGTDAEQPIDSHRL